MALHTLTSVHLSEVTSFLDHFDHFPDFCQSQEIFQVIWKGLAAQYRFVRMINRGIHDLNKAIYESAHGNFILFL